ncbi:MAG: hypothetical protein ACE5J2_07430 [Nitrososphaerales archaeon]
MPKERNRRVKPNGANAADKPNGANAADKPNGANAADKPNGANEPNAANSPDGPMPDGSIQITKRKKSGKSTVTKAHPTSPSLRATIPYYVIEALGWEAGDVLSWEIVKLDGKYFVKVRRLE